MTKKMDSFLQRVGDLREMLDALERIPGALFMIKDLDSRYVYMSRGLREAIHLPPGMEVVGKTDFDLFPKIIAQSFRENDRKVFLQGRPLLNEVHAAIFFDQTPIWAVSSKFPLRDRAGNIMGLITVNEPYNQIAGADEELNRLLPALEEMTKHYARSLRLGALARSCGYSERHFARLFRARMGKTARQFLEQVRMFHALDALRRSNRPVAEIGMRCGFYDHSSFVKSFRAHTGTTPLRWRRTQQESIKSERATVLPDPERQTEA
jgi:AraC-like DNA-binding protein